MSVPTVKESGVVMNLTPPNQSNANGRLARQIIRAADAETAKDGSVKSFTLVISTLFKMNERLADCIYDHVDLDDAAIRAQTISTDRTAGAKYTVICDDNGKRFNVTVV